MDIGLHVERKAPSELSPLVMFENIIEQVRVAHESGFDIISTGQHFLVDDLSMLQTFPLLSRLSAETGSMSVMTGVTLLPLLHPIDVAETIATLDVFADGVICGVGAGYRDAEFESFGIDKSERAGRLEEGVELMRRLWTEESVSFDGEYYSVHDVGTKLRPESPPPVWIAANTRPAIERAALIGDGWFVNPHASISEIVEQKRTYDTIRRDQGLETDTPVFRECFVAPTHEEAIDTAGEFLAEKAAQYVKWGQNEAMEDQDELRQAFDDLRTDRFLLGTPSEVCAEIDRMQEDIGMSDLILRVQWPGLANEHAIECLELLGDEVIPSVT